MWYAVTDCCPNACYFVVVVKDKATGILAAYCRDCGAAWLSPGAFEEDDFVIGSQKFREGIVQPTHEEIQGSAWLLRIQETVDDADYSTAAVINEQMNRERSGRD